MKSIARLRNLRIAPRKVRLVADLIRGKNVPEARSLLQFAIKRGALPVSNLLHSAVTSAKNQFEVEEQNLFITKITVDEGRKLKRWDPRSRGRAYPIQKKTSHVTMVLDTERPVAIKKKEKNAATTASVEMKEGKKEKRKFQSTQERVTQRKQGMMNRMFRRKTI